jgi:hypothetical protein
MAKHLSLLVCLLAVCASSAFAGVAITAPANGAVMQGAVSFNASATTSCSKGIGSMGIYTAPGVLAHVSNGPNLNTQLSLNPGTYNTTVVAWDNCGGASTAGRTITISAETGVYVSSPASNTTVTSPVNFAATASTTCSKGIGSMGIYTAPYQLAYTSNGPNLNHPLALSPGKYNAVVQEWDNCGGSTTTPVTITVGGNAFSNLQNKGGWNDYGQGPPNFVDCSPSPCDGIKFSWQQGVQSPSMDGKAAQFNLGGTSVYSDGLWNNHLIGDLSSQGMPDNNHSLIPTLHNFTYDVYFWVSDLNVSQAVEFDINQFFGGLGYVWGHECRIAGGNEWDIWNPVTAQWIPTGVGCHPNANAWNHLTIQVQRTNDNQLLYQSITLNGNTHTLNQYYKPAPYPGWYGVTVNYQMDGDYKQDPYSVYLDQLTFSYE